MNRLQRTMFFSVAVFCAVPCLLICISTVISLLSPIRGRIDFQEYWASGQQLVHHANPYSQEAITALERSAGRPADDIAMIMGNLPAALPIVLPLGLLGSRPALFLWTFLEIASVFVSVHMLTTIFGAPRSRLRILGYTFAPVFSCIAAGQISLFILLGLVLFLRLHRSHAFLAGLSLWLCMLKPQLFLPFGVVVLLWSVMERKYGLIAGAATSLAVSSSIVTMLDPQVWTQYRVMMDQMRMDSLPIPCLGSLLRRSVPPHSFWLQCLPAALGILWAMAYFWSRRREWDWMRDGAIVMIVSVLVMPYGWFMDEVVLIPALLYGAYAARSLALAAFLALTSAVVEIEMIFGLHLHASNFYLWTVPVWLLWFLIAVRRNPIAIENQRHLTARSI